MDSNEPFTPNRTIVLQDIPKTMVYVHCPSNYWYTEWNHVKTGDKVKWFLEVSSFDNIQNVFSMSLSQKNLNNYFNFHVCL